MGVIDTPQRPIPSGSQQNLLLKAAADEVQDKGYVLATLDNLVYRSSPKRPAMLRKPNVASQAATISNDIGAT